MSEEVFQGRKIPKELELRISSIEEFDKLIKEGTKPCNSLFIVDCTGIRCNECILGYWHNTDATRKFLLSILKEDISLKEIEEDFLL